MSHAAILSKRATPRDRFAAMPRDYAGLVAMYPPRRVRRESDARRATAIIADLIGFDLTADQTDYVALLARLNEEWKRARPEFKRAAPHELVRLIIEEHGMTQSQMGEAIGVTRSGMSMILSGERELSKASIRRFCNRFAIDAGAML